jgi:hypothetical protein
MVALPFRPQGAKRAVAVGDSHGVISLSMPTTALAPLWHRDFRTLFLYFDALYRLRVA